MALIGKPNWKWASLIMEYYLRRNFQPTSYRAWRDKIILAVHDLRLID